ncbi:MAG: ribonuclease P protein component 1 [Methanosarcinales archaeon Met12]|nr:MAG: ribonuclease P protein component 1 [Methanosarcinales archaeon Met12]
MDITPKNLIHHELIGLTTKIVASTAPNQIGLKGKIVDETRNMFMIEKEDHRIKKTAKEGVTFVFMLSDAKVKVNGKLLLARPENRVQKRR